MMFHSGIGTYIRNLLPYLKEAFTALRVLAPITFVDKWPDLAHFDLIPITAPLYSVQEQIRLPLNIPESDLFWTPHYNIPLPPIRAKKRIVTIHDVYHLVYGHTLSLPKRIYSQVMIRAAVRYSSLVITGSQFSKNEIVKYAHALPDKVTVVHNGVNCGHFSSSPQSNVKELYNLPENYFLFVSTLAPHKNLTRLLKAWNQVIGKYPDWSLVLAGKEVKNKEYLQVFDLFPNLRSRVRLLGEVKEQDLPALYENGYAAISPSLYEGFGLPPLEAMAMGCPTVVSRAASHPEVCGEASLYIDPYDEEDIAQKIILLIENESLRKTLSEKGTKRVELFTWKKTAEAHIDLMNGVVSS